MSGQYGLIAGPIATPQAVAAPLTGPQVYNAVCRLPRPVPPGTPETKGPDIHVRVIKDRVQISVDASGELLLALEAIEGD